MFVFMYSTFPNTNNDQEKLSPVLVCELIMVIGNVNVSGIKTKWMLLH